MGGGTWTNSASTTYYASRGFSSAKLKSLDSSSVKQFYTSTHLHESLNPKRIMRECCDSEEHPNTIPIILGLDVTGSMGSACAAVAKKLNEIMTSLYKKYKDVEFCVMGIGDMAYDRAPVQMSQFESDVRILEQLDKIYMEHGGGGNGYESYTAAWYMGAYHTKLDCWKRGKKGIIITMGDESLNPYLPESRIREVMGDAEVGKTETAELYEIASEKYDIYHISITDPGASFGWHHSDAEETFGKLLKERYLQANSDDLPDIITRIVDDAFANAGNTISLQKESAAAEVKVNENGKISW